MPKIKLPHAQNLAQDVEDASRALNKAVVAAILAGLVVDMEIKTVLQFPNGATPFVEAVAKIAPSNIDLED